ncbi:hypothetical protein HELRODRAFT_159064 [Helobdella robusta]|uniref:Uncharacterized protein n=1 Tax=Helobdella robusta TaxID=6412 RepID=T1ENJ7_HELRO|nr:hypothetical protein HELRODRAFT_159064 [Helobdella robusta]ESO12512.1 hypothetical protein HELRODRAFT_159064 [Helobdella robusta]
MYIFNQSTRCVTGVVNVDRLPVLLSSLVDGTTKLLGVPSFLDVLVENWSDTPSFQVAAVFIKNLVCINDSAERGVALVQHFNETITKDAEQKQFLLQVVEQHRKNFADYNRELLAKNENFAH